MSKQAFSTISADELSQISGGGVIRHELWQLNNALQTSVTQQSSSTNSQTMMAMCMAMALARR